MSNYLHLLPALLAILVLWRFPAKEPEAGHRLTYLQTMGLLFFTLYLYQSNPTAAFQLPLLAYIMSTRDLQATHAVH